MNVHSNREHGGLAIILPARRALRSSWIVEHEDTRWLGRVRAVHDFLVATIERDRAMFVTRP